MILIVGVHDAPHAHKPHVAHAHIHEASVLSRSHVHHSAPEAGLLIHEPVSVHHMRGHAVGHAVTIHDVVTVIHQFVHLASKVFPLIDSHPVRATVLKNTRLNNQTCSFYFALSYNPLKITYF